MTTPERNTFNFFFIFYAEMKSKVHIGVGVGQGWAVMMSISTSASFKYRFSFSGLAKKWREISIHKIYIFICDSWELFGAPFWSDVRKKIST